MDAVGSIQTGLHILFAEMARYYQWGSFSTNPWKSSAFQWWKLVNMFVLSLRVWGTWIMLSAISRKTKLQRFSCNLQLRAKKNPEVIWKTKLRSGIFLHERSCGSSKNVSAEKCHWHQWDGCSGFNKCWHRICNWNPKLKIESISPNSDTYSWVSLEWTCLYWLWRVPRVTSSYVKVYVLGCLILTKMNLTYKSQSLIFSLFFCASVFLHEVRLLATESELLFYLQKIQEKVGKKINNWIRQTKCLCYKSKYHIKWLPLKLSYGRMCIKGSRDHFIL